MVTKEMVRAEIDRISTEHLDELYRLIKHFTADKETAPKPSLMARLSKIKIDGPEDFAVNLDLYLHGEKRAE